MQGFNRYFPPDFDPEKHVTLNSYHGKHALGDRARKIDKGILITRFELPFNIWCGTCNNHIGMGVRYNAEKKKVGSYYTTPIYSFRCKCHLCSGWFEIQTDPKNTAYVVTSGARKQVQDWDPEDVGGFAPHETNPAQQAPADAFASLEKTTTALHTLQTQTAPRLTSLTHLSARRSADPYTLSSSLRHAFRTEKKAEKRKRDEEEGVRKKYGLDEGLKLVGEDEKESEEEESVKEEAKRVWEAQRMGWEADAKAERARVEAKYGEVKVNPTAHTRRDRESSSLRHPSSRRVPYPSSSSSKPPISKAKAPSTLASTLLFNSLSKRDSILPSSSFASSSRGKLKTNNLGIIIGKK